MSVFLLDKKTKLSIGVCGIAIVLITVLICTSSFLCSNNINFKETSSMLGIDYTLELNAVAGTELSGLGGTVQINEGVASDYASAVVNTPVSTTITAVANEGYEFSGWYTDVFGGQLKSYNEVYTFDMPFENTTYYAIFSAYKYLVNIQTAPLGSGNITGAGSHDYGSLVTITASPISPNYQFYRWLEDGSEISINNSYSFNIYEDKDFVAEFRPKVTVNANGYGTAIIGTSGNTTEGYYKTGEQLTLTAIPDEGYQFISWSGDSTSVSENINIVVGTVAAIYNANFQIEGAILDISSTAGGNTLGSSNNQSYSENSLLTFVATADLEYHFVGWQGTYSGTLDISASTTSYRVTAEDVVRGSISITAQFIKNSVIFTAYVVTNEYIGGLGGTVSINDNTPEIESYLAMPPGQTVNVKVFINDSYVFRGWYSDEFTNFLLTSEEEFDFNMLSQDISYYALFETSYWTDYASMPVGNGANYSPYQITMPEELAWIALQTNNNSAWSEGVYVDLKNSLNLGEYVWEPIGSNSSGDNNTRWLGYFDGNGFIIYDLKIEQEAIGISYNGLFGYISGENTYVKNLGLSVPQITVLATSNTYVGSFVGYLNNGLIQNCYSDAGNIAAGFSGVVYAYVGGIVGNNFNGQIKESYNTNEIIVNNVNENSTYIGGIVGNNYGGEAVVEEVYYAGEAMVDQTDLGMSTLYAGALVGYNSLGAAVNYSFYNSDVTAFNAIGVNNSIDNFNQGKSTIEMRQQATYEEIASGWGFETKWVLGDENYTEGYPVLIGIGNLAVTAIATTDNGTITPEGTQIYYEGGASPTFMILTDSEYVIDTLLVDGVIDRSYSGRGGQLNLTLNNSIGNSVVEVSFRLSSNATNNFVSFLGVLSIFIIIFWLIFRKTIKSVRKRAIRLRSALKRYKNNKYKK